MCGICDAQELAIYDPAGVVDSQLKALKLARKRGEPVQAEVIEVVAYVQGLANIVRGDACTHEYHPNLALALRAPMGIHHFQGLVSEVQSLAQDAWMRSRAGVGSRKP